VLDYEYICDRIAKFHKEILFITRVVNIQILTTKYFSFQYSATYCSQALRASSPQSTWDSASVNSWNTRLHHSSSVAMANSPDLNPVDYQIWESCRRVCTAARYVTLTSWSSAWSKSENISSRWSSIKRSGSGVHIFEIAFDFEHIRWTFWTQTLGVLKSCHSHGRTLDSQSRLCL